MPDTRAPTVPQFTRRLGIETPEHLVLELELAGLGSRMAATLCDAGVLTLAYLLLGLAIQLLPTQASGDANGPWSTLGAIVLIVTLFLLFWGYFLLFEGLNEGRTPGKRLMGIRVVMDTGHPLTFTAAAVRNLVRIVDMQPLFTYQVGLGFVLFHRQNKRLGDIVAGTVVVRDRPENLLLTSAATDRAPEPEALEAGPPELSDEEFRLLDQLLERLEGLEGAVRHRLTAELVARFAPRFPQRDADYETFLVRLHGAELAKRRGRLAARHAPGVGRTSVAAERFVMQKREGWETFRTLAARAERLGLKQLGAADIPGFAARYREVASDLARARTYGVDPRVLEYLERVVSAGHNALYGRHTGQRVAIVRLVLRELPAAVVEARAFVLAALLLFALPAATGYLAIRERPAIAEEVLPDEMIARARAGAGRRAEGVGYAEAPSMYLPVVASRIITNNVQVAFFAFAFGITAGIGTLLLLTLNGLFFGAVLGLFANYGLAGWLLTFVAGHGVLELTAIFIAGGAGLLVARGLIAPGDLTRRDALVLAGRRAARLVAAAVLLLCLAGTIEGLLSASDAAPAYKFAVSAASALLLACYFASGRAYLRSRASAAPAAAATAATGTTSR
ncbi:MAG TPA: stage II sporulation protein M [Gemmatimonadales bacterium]|nr:stage II sporulation protein M [Gemmatimonadales bacterium]